MSDTLTFWGGFAIIVSETEQKASGSTIQTAKEFIMKKIVSLILVTVMLLAVAVGMTSCGEKVTCSICNEEGRAGSMEKEELFGKVIYTCKDCVEDLEKLGDLFN
jgi:hypothetical protein